VDPFPWAEADGAVEAFSRLKKVKSEGEPIKKKATLVLKNTGWLVD